MLHNYESGMFLVAHRNCELVGVAPSGLAEKDEEEDAADEDPRSKFANYQETVMLRQSKPGPKRGLVSPLCDKEEPALRDDAGRRVRFQPRMRDGNATEVPPTLQAGGASVFTVGREPSDECGMFRDDASERHLDVV